MILITDDLKIYGEQNEPLRVVSVRLPNTYIAAARELGHGSFTEGIRYALSKAVICKQGGCTCLIP